MTTATPRRRALPTWAVAEGPFGVRLFDVGVVALVIAAVEVNVNQGGGADAVSLNLAAYLAGALLAVPILFRHRWPFRVLLATTVLIFFYYIFERRNISPAAALCVPLYDTALAGGYLAWVIAIPACYMGIGLGVVATSIKESASALASNFLPQIAVLALAVMIGEVVRSRRALAAETARRLRLAAEERAAESGRLVAEERLRIARELHDTVAHSMATITVQAGSALHLLGPGHASADALSAIRETSKAALTEMRSVLGQLHAGAAPPAAGLDRLDALCDAVTAAGATVTVTVEGDRAPLSAEADHSAYRILQESLTNVLRHAGPGASARTCLRYRPGALTITVTDDGPGSSGTDGDGTGEHGSSGTGGHGIRGMRERAASVGGELTAGRLPGRGFQVTATLPTAAGDVAAGRAAVEAVDGGTGDVPAGREGVS